MDQSGTPGRTQAWASHEPASGKAGPPGAPFPLDVERWRLNVRCSVGRETSNTEHSTSNIEILRSAQRRGRSRFMAGEQVRKEQGAFHERRPTPSSLRQILMRPHYSMSLTSERVMAGEHVRTDEGTSLEWSLRQPCRSLRRPESLRWKPEGIPTVKALPSGARALYAAAHISG